MNTLKVVLPSGAKASISLPGDKWPEGMDDSLILIATKAFVGILTVISEIEIEEAKRNFLLRFVSSMAALADNALRSTQMVSAEHSTTDKQAIEALLKSIRETHTKD